MKHLRNLFFILCTMYYALFTITRPAVAIYDPLSVPNNKVGVHILSPDEIARAASLINTNGGDWGYVTVPIQPTDRDQDKWQSFMDQARELHLIPIVRITTIPHGGTWATGADTDLVDFANFLNELIWPVENRYIILFNEVNRDQEWGGKVDPIKYTRIVKNARQIFQERNSSFYLLGPALDSALPDSKTSMSASTYLKKMEDEDSAIWSYFDGWASHSYPNPGFSAPPTKTGWQSIVSYRTETSTLKLAPKPVFITETGWSQSALSPSLLESYWKQAWTIWQNDAKVAAVTPFLLSGGSQFREFSMYSDSGALTTSGNMLKDLKKAAGKPKLTSGKPTPKPDPVNTNHTSDNSSSNYVSGGILLKIENFFRNLFGLTQKGSLTVGGAHLTVELADSSSLWEQGLSGKDSLAQGTGMLFVFPRTHIPVFWMKDMNFPIDIIWISNNVISDITTDVPVSQNGQFPTYSPETPIDMVLEVPAGYSNQVGLRVGDAVILKK